MLSAAIVQTDVQNVMQAQYLLPKTNDDDNAFSYEMEQLHGSVHVVLGGTLGFMRSIKTAAEDPIFWMHHCNIDHLWEKWTRQTNAPMPDKNSPWMTQKFYFFDENGKRVSMTGKDIVNIAQQLKYIYEDVPAKIDEPSADMAPTMVTAAPPIFQKVTVASATKLSLSADKNIITLPSTPEAMFANLNGGKYTLIFEQITLKGWADGTFELYFNQNLNETFDPSHDNYIGAVNFFGINETEAKNGMQSQRLKNQRFKVTTAINAYLAKNKSLDGLQITIYHRTPELDGVSAPQTVAIQANVGTVKLVKQ